MELLLVPETVRLLTIFLQQNLAAINGKDLSFSHICIFCCQR